MPLPQPNEIEISLFGPGYGECVVAHLGAGKWLVIDSCHDPNRRPLGLVYLQELGVNVKNDVQLVISTHWHDDHIRGLCEVVRLAESAQFVMSGAMSEKQFLGLVEAMRGVGSFDATGVNEWIGILSLLTDRKQNLGTGYISPNCIVGERRILNRPSDLQNKIPACEVWTLSPSDESFISARAAFSALMPKPGTAPVRLLPQGPNHTSIVVHIQFGNSCVLLGADLEQTHSHNTGWTAIVNSGNRPQDRAHVFKIPHHGSSNGHNDDVWANMLHPNPISIISPFVHGKTVLPSDSDLLRLKSKSDACYVTIEPVEAKKRRKTKNLADISLNMQVKEIRPIPFGTGHIRLRKVPDQEWSVTLNGTAKKI